MWFWHPVHPLSPAVTPEAIGFLSAVGVFVILLTILFLFINKKLCFARVGGLPCFELRGHRKRKERSGIHQGLGEYTVMKHLDLRTQVWILQSFRIDLSQSRMSFKILYSSSPVGIIKNIKWPVFSFIYLEHKSWLIISSSELSNIKCRAVPGWMLSLSYAHIAETRNSDVHAH